MDQAGLRCFDAVYVNPVVGVQSPANRFGSGSDQHASHAPPPSVTTTLTEESWQGSDSDEDEFEDEIFAGQAGYAFDSGAASSPTRGSTRFARLRTNLTALSQVYNVGCLASSSIRHQLFFVLFFLARCSCAYASANMMFTTSVCLALFRCVPGSYTCLQPRKCTAGATQSSAAMLEADAMSGRGHNSGTHKCANAASGQQHDHRHAR